ncbi:unnamed protein product [Rotaria sp. Silwood1]|nr:unnamed protein product [Rotaria sp. Silwood1]CAF1425701.1 unnamed protein product [Rotaria sp. Silwood1]CAF3587549.1 unnamed protein product [Rotaria sp. Silwood1]CAF3597280.1 unnamed protein product [Rotaria sp. Silwood1]CAF4718763.1 unnamed protein product [Rotaria sp. Silwood1]
MNLIGIRHHQFDHVVSEILPYIGSYIRSFMLNGNWETILSTKALTILFAPSISFMFSKLQKLTLKLFSGERLLAFLDNMIDFLQLVKLDIRFLKKDADDKLMTKIFASNNGRLQSISFDDESIALKISEDDDKNMLFPNIQELRIKLEFINILPRLFKIIPNVQRLHVCVEKTLDEEDHNHLFIDLSPFIYLTDFHLRLVKSLGMFDDITNILRQMPFLQKLTLDLWTRDERLINGNNLISILPSSLKQFHFLIRYYISETNFEIDHVLPTWPNHIPIKYFLDEDNNCVILYTIPCCLRSTILSATISKNLPSSWTHIQQVEDLQINDVTSFNEILLIVQHFHRLQRLTIDVKNKLENVTTSVPSIRLYLPRLKKLEIHGVCQLFPLLQAAPNLEFLIVKYDCLKTLLDDEPTCNLLRKRIVRLEIFQGENIDSEELQRIADVFNNLIEFILNMKESKIVIDLIILTALTLWNKKELFSLHIGGSMSDEATQNLQKWLINHTDLTLDHSFATTYESNWFSLWW